VSRDPLGVRSRRQRQRRREGKLNTGCLRVCLPSVYHSYHNDSARLLNVIGRPFAADRGDESREIKGRNRFAESKTKSS